MRGGKNRELLFNRYSVSVSEAEKVRDSGNDIPRRLYLMPLNCTLKMTGMGEFLGGLMVRTLNFHCRGLG